MGWGGFLDKLIDKLPIQNRIERWKNERENLKKEEASLLILNLDINKKEDRDKAKRLTWVRNRITYLDQLLRNK